MDLKNKNKKCVIRSVISEFVYVVETLKQLSFECKGDLLSINNSNPKP